MSTTSLTSLRTFIKSLHGWTLNIEKAQSSINGMNVSMHNYLEYTILTNASKIYHISFHWFDLSGCMHYLNRISEAIWPLNLFFKSCRPKHVCFYRKEVLTFCTQFLGCLFTFWFLIWKFWNTIYEFLTLYVEFPFRFFI